MADPGGRTQALSPRSRRCNVEGRPKPKEYHKVQEALAASQERVNILQLQLSKTKTEPKKSDIAKIRRLK